MTDIIIRPVQGIPLVQAGDDISAHILDALDFALQDRDVLVISSKIVSKSQGRLVHLDDVHPGAQAVELAQITRKDPRIVELVLQESTEVSRSAPGVLITRHRLGFTSANAGIDQSNIGGQDAYALLLPLDPDASARQIRQRIQETTGTAVSIIISDTHGRPFRLGNIGVAIGVSGVPALLDLRGRTDLYGRELRASIQGYADLVASAAHLACGEADEGIPVVLVRGLQYNIDDVSRASDLHREPERDLYR